MHKTTSQMSDAVFANSDALDAVFDFYSFDIDDQIEETILATATRLDQSLHKAKSNRENLKRLIPWLGL